MCFELSGFNLLHRYLKTPYTSLLKSYMVKCAHAIGGSVLALLGIYEISNKVITLNPFNNTKLENIVLQRQIQYRTGVRIKTNVAMHIC